MKIKSLQFRVTRFDDARYFGNVRKASDILMLIAHATVGGTFKSSVQYMNRDLDDPKGPGKKTSYHYGIERDGGIHRMLDPLIISYGAGDSAWPNPVHWSHGGNDSSVNHKAINIAFALEEHELPTEIQLESGYWLFRTLMERFDIPSTDVRGHLEVSPGRKFDPQTIPMVSFRARLDEVELVP